MSTGIHWSDCAMHNEPAEPNGPCDCGADAPKPWTSWKVEGDLGMWDVGNGDERYAISFSGPQEAEAVANLLTEVHWRRAVMEKNKIPTPYMTIEAVKKMLRDMLEQDSLSRGEYMVWNEDIIGIAKTNGIKL